MKTKSLYDFLFYFGIVWAGLCFVGHALSDNFVWIYFSMFGIVIFTFALIMRERERQKLLNNDTNNKIVPCEKSNNDALYLKDEGGKHDN